MVCCQSFPGFANLASNYECQNAFSVRYTTICVIFSNFFLKNSTYKLETPNPVLAAVMLYEYFQDLRISPPNMTARIFVVFEMTCVMNSFYFSEI